MEQVAFRMRLKPGCAAEYKRRHDALWPELASLLHEAGVRDYSIFLDEESLALFAVLRRAADHRMDELPLHPVMQRWWAEMAELMEVEPSSAPCVVDLKPMFHLE
ncbi:MULTISPECIES: L-rhamnose mutarotase [unclassified Rhizobacter]|uniref:L-rhamnose mutarotase n=1 Tax=unclassified Rhizobacter TaxID=2640088 RepID=UPI000701BCE0|nr:MULTISPECIES: L-rhamnose mutarotase [unclassified Rhizobacter]KQU78482.1 L-rhamnose mutarotase [Rhizobacter sp. Root29]KQW11002.1 L-rhamnose mutarotase [Rhizobacter sp. Root1238]KRB25348.1 L-rhamnose mutarotase [Rhizobacter sp. Root16D2]